MENGQNKILAVCKMKRESKSNSDCDLNIDNDLNPVKPVTLNSYIPDDNHDLRREQK